MAKWDYGLAGSSCHVHTSLVGADGAPVFADGSDGYTDIFKHYIAGQLALARDLTLFLAPYINSYKRFQAGSFAPTKAIWSTDNRTAGFRVVGRGPSLRVECRIPGADANPYLAFAALLAAGLHGIEQKLELEPAFAGDAYRGEDIREIPKTLREAIELPGRARRCCARRSATPWSSTTCTRALGAVRVRPPDHRPRADPRLRAGLSGDARAADFAGRTAVVTGAGGGMGLRDRARASGGGRQGRRDRPQGAAAALDAARYERGRRQRRRLRRPGDRARVRRRDGRLDYLVNAAGVLLFGEDRSLLEIELDVWNRVIAINLTGCMLTARHAIPLMQRSGGGAMVHFSSIQCLRGDDQPQDAYQVAKAGILALSKSIAIQFATDQIRSNVILPGPTESPMQARWQTEPEMRHRTAAAVPLGRVGSVADMADACLFLLSERVAFITGTELIVDGGLMARP